MFDSLLDSLLRLECQSSHERAGEQESVPIMTMTNVPSVFVISVTCENSFWTSFPDSENHFENSE